MSISELERNDVFQNHVRMFMSTISAVTDGLENSEKDAMNDMLLMLGAKHATITNFDCAFFV